MWGGGGAQEAGCRGRGYAWRGPSSFGEAGVVEQRRRGGGRRGGVELQAGAVVFRWEGRALLCGRRPCLDVGVVQWGQSVEAGGASVLKVARGGRGRGGGGGTLLMCWLKRLLVGGQVEPIGRLVMGVYQSENDSKVKGQLSENVQNGDGSMASKFRKEVT